MIRDTALTDCSIENIEAAVDVARDVPRLEIVDGENWTPSVNQPGFFKRSGMNRWATFSSDFDGEATGDDANFVKKPEHTLEEAMCGTPSGAPAPC